MFWDWFDRIPLVLFVTSYKGPKSIFFDIVDGPVLVQLRAEDVVLLRPSRDADLIQGFEVAQWAVSHNVRARRLLSYSYEVQRCPRCCALGTQRLSS